MPRIRTKFEVQSIRADRDLVTRLAEELKSDRKSGQPVIYEQLFPTGLLSVTVVWDEWGRLPLEKRTETILQAYDKAGSHEEREKITLASGLTVPEAHAAGMLPYRIIPARRASDPVTLEQCRKAMIEEGASILLSPTTPPLLFATLEEAEAARTRLTERLPGSDPVWNIAEEIGGVDEWSYF